MSNLFKKLAGKIRTSGLVIPVFLASLVTLAIGAGTSVEDYGSSLYGYRLLPTQKVNDWVIPLVALLPQAGQIVFGFIYAKDTEQRWAGLAWCALHVFDVGTDVYFKAYGQPAWVWLAAFVETEVVFSLGSELLLVLSAGLALELWPSAIRQARRVLKQTRHALFR